MSFCKNRSEYKRPVEPVWRNNFWFYVALASLMVIILTTLFYMDLDTNANVLVCTSLIVTSLGLLVILIVSCVPSTKQSHTNDGRGNYAPIDVVVDGFDGDRV